MPFIRFLGVDPEPRPGLPSGHIPNSFSLPFNLLLKTNPLKEGGSYTTFLPPQELRKALVESVGEEYADKLIKGEQPVTTSCGSGMTAGVVWLALKLLGLEKINLYDEVSVDLSGHVPQADFDFQVLDRIRQEIYE